MTTLMGFILNTIKPRVNDPANAKMWLPALLMSMRNDDGTPVLPIQATEQDLGALQGHGGEFVADRFADVYSVMNQVNAVPDPAAPLPTLSLPRVTLDGLQNIMARDTPDTPEADGYQVDIHLLLDAYTGTVSGIEMKRLTFSGRYHIDQSLQVTPDSGPVNLTTISGDGEFSATLTHGKIIAGATASISGSGAGRVNTISVERLDLAGTDGRDRPVLDFTTLTLDGDLPQKDMLIAAIQDALGDPEGQQAILSGIAGMLNAPANLASVNALVSDRTAGVLDGIFGPLPPSGLPVDEPQQQALTAVDQYLFDRVRLAFTQSDSSWFLPLQLASSDDPVLEPYTNASVDVPDQTIKGLQYTNIALTGLVLAGASNAAAPLDRTLLADTAFSTLIALGTLPEGAARPVPRQSGPVSMPVPPAPPISFTAGFSLVQQGFKPVPLQGTLAATIAGVQVPMTIAPSGADVDQLTLTFSAVSADLDGAQIVPSVSLNPSNGPLEQILDILFARPDVQQQILAALNAALAQQTAAISAQFTQIARAAILSQIGG